VDSLEGISHALRSNEYHDRNALYDWFFTTAFPEIQKVVIEDFSRLNFKYVLLSKRKLQHFVDKGLVSGWDHPSFPTIQGVWRRGLTYEALRDFVLSQGGSKATNLMEMEKLWAVNKGLIDPEIPRHTAIASNKVKLVLSDDVKLYSKKAPRHKKNPALGEKDVYYSNVVYLEPADAAAIKVNEEVTLMDWGNAIITEKVHGEDGSVKELKGKLHLEGDFKTTEKKLTWLAEGAPLVPVKLEEYHYLIKKEKLEEGDNLDDFINSPLVTVTEAIGDPNLASLPVGTKLQLERRGYYIVDKAASSPEGLVLINTPDGKKTNVYKLGE
jgi:glutamyl-tRNA synthetase